jgi:hypothetical protein
MMGKKGKGAANAGKKRPDDELVDLIFSWSLQDVMNQDLFRDKVRRSLSSLHLLARWSIAVLVALHRKLFFSSHRSLQVVTARCMRSWSLIKHAAGGPCSVTG